MKKIWNALDGNKTNVGMIAWGVYNILIQMSPNIAAVLSPDIVNTALMAWVGISFRDAIRKVE